MKKTLDMYLPIILLYVLSAYFLLDTEGFTPDSLLYPKILSCALIVLNTLLLILTVAKRITIPKEDADRSQRKFFIVLGTSVAYIASIRFIGFAISSLIYCPLTAVLLGYEKKAVALAVSAAIIGTVYVCFRLILKVPIPVIDLLGIRI